MHRSRPALAITLAIMSPWSVGAQTPDAAATSPPFDQVQATIRRMQEKLERLGSAATERDQALQFLQQQVEQATGEIAGTGKTNDSLRGEAATLADKVQDLSADRDKLRGEVGTRNETVALLETQLSTLADDLRAASGREAVLQGRVAALEAAAGKSQEDLAAKAVETDALQRRMVELEADVGRSSSLAAERGTEVDRLNLDLATARETAEEERHHAAIEVASLKTQLSTLAASLQAASKRETMLQSRVAAMEAAAGKSQEDLASRAAEAEALQQRLTELETARGSEAERLNHELAAARAAAEEAKRKGAIAVAAAEGAAAALRRQVESLGQDVTELNDQLSAAETTVDQQREQIDGLDSRLSAALAQRVEELEQYRSEFFGQLKRALGDRPDLRVVGDRFVFQSELLFDSGSARLDPEGQAELRALARTLQDVAGRIPSQIDWVLRVDGHTDRQPIRDGTFASNWELSTARAISVIQFLVAQGIPPEHLAAAGFGEYRPIDPADDEIAYRRNRRIEFKLTEG